MAEIITISVKTSGVDKAIRSLKELQELGLAIGKATPTVQISTSGLSTAAKQTDNYTQSVKNAQSATQSLGSMIAKNASWYLISGAVSKATGAIQDAISTMKAVDDELVTVRKVTGATTEEMARLESQAYNTASAYGVAANEYLSSVAAFSRAGYGDAAAGLAELSTKTQIVGDTSAETANQFLLSVDAAYKYQGSIEKLTAVLDGANELDNKYATSIEKIAEGMGIVAPVAAQAKVGVDELAAALGTITAVTQRSGSEAARAYRALVLNIMGDTTTMFETETGELTHYTADEVAGLQQVVQEYAGTALEAAKATGEVVNPMEVMAALAQSVKDGFLTEAEFMKTVTDISGKLRSSQMFALIQNWDMYESMLADFGGAVGSADAEVANAMDSWTRKTEILRNTWTEFISQTVDTGWIKGLTDGVTWLISGFDNLGNVIAVVGGAMLALRWGDITTKLKDPTSGINQFGMALKSLPGLFSKAQHGAEGFNNNMELVGSKLTAGSLAIGVLTTVISTAIVAYNKWRDSVREAAAESSKEAAAANQSAAETLQLYGAYKTAEQGSQTFADAVGALGDKLGEEASGGMSAYIAKLDELTEAEMRAAVGAANAAVAANAKNVMADAYTPFKSFVFQFNEDIGAMSTGVSSLDKKITEILSGAGTKADGGKWTPFSKSIEDVEKFYDAVVEVQKLMQESSSGGDDPIFNTKAYKQTVKIIDSLGESMSGYKQAVNTQLESLAIAKIADDLTKMDINSQEAFNSYIEGIKNSTEYSDKHKDVIIELAGEVFPEFSEAQKQAADAAGDVSEALTEQEKSAQELEKSLQGAQTALKDYANIRDNLPDHGDAFKEYANVYHEAMELFNQGLTGTVQYKSAIDMLMPEEVLSAMVGGYQEAGETLASEFWQAVFADNGEDYGQNFANALKESADEAGQYFNDAGELLATFETQADGTFDMVVEDVEALAEALGTTPEVISVILDALDALSADTEYFGEDALDFARELNGVLTEIPGNVHQIDLGAFISQAAEAGKTASEIYGLIQALESMDGVSLTNVPASLEDTIVKAVSAEGAVGEAKAAVDDLDTSEANPEVKLDTSAADNALTSFKNRLSSLARTPTIVTIIERTVQQNAGGTKNAAPGQSVVNEEGPELILSGDKAYIAGGGKPAMTILKKGDVVFTAEETQQIMARKGQQQVFPRFSKGRASGIKNYSASGSRSDYTGSSGRRSSYGGGTANVKVTVDTEKAMEELEDFLKDAEHQIFLWEREGGREADIAAKYKELQEKLHDTADDFRKQGLDETSDEIQEFQKKWWGYADEIEDVYESIAKAQKELWDELEDAVDEQLKDAKKARDTEVDAIDRYIDQLKKRNEEDKKELELQEKQNAVLEAQNKLLDVQNERTVRVYDAETNQWDWVTRPDDVSAAQEALDKAEKDLEDYLKEMALDEEIEALEQRKAAIQSSYDAFEAEWENILKSIEEPGRDIGEIMADIAANGAPRMQAAIDSVSEMLAKLGNYKNAAVGKDTAPSVAAGNYGSGRDYTNDTTDYSQLMMDADNWEAVNVYAAWRDQKAAAQGIDYEAMGWKTTEQIKKEWAAAHPTYDRGGVLKGMGGIKATDKDEIVLGPDLTAELLNPAAGKVFQQRVAELGYIYGERDNSVFSGRDKMITNNTGSTNHYGGPYYINGVEIGAREAETMTLADLARQLRVLSLYRNS